jgi:hypothetical protein
VPEEAAPDSKSEYAPPRALPAAQRTVLGMSPPVSVDLPPGNVNTSLTSAAPAAYEPDIDSAKLDTIPPRRRQAGARRIVFGVMGVALALVAAVGVRQILKSSSPEAAPSPARVEVVTKTTPTPPQPPVPEVPPPPPPTTEVAAAPAEPAAADTAEAPEPPAPEKPAADTHRPVAEVAPARPAPARQVQRRPAPPRPEKKTTTRQKEPGKASATTPPPSPGGGSIVRESPF